MARLGLDTDHMQHLVSKLNQAAGNIEAAASMVTNQVNGTYWEGGDAARFKNEWNGGHRQTLKQVADALRRVADNARKELAQQQATSQ